MIISAHLFHLTCPGNLKKGSLRGTIFQTINMTNEDSVTHLIAYLVGITARPYLPQLSAPPDQQDFRLWFSGAPWTTILHNVFILNANGAC